MTIWTHTHTHPHNKKKWQWNRKTIEIDGEAQHALKCATHTHTEANTGAHLEHLTALRGDSQDVCVCVHTHFCPAFVFAHIESHFHIDSANSENCRHTMLRCRWRIRNIAHTSIVPKLFVENSKKKTTSNDERQHTRSLTTFYHTITGILCAFHM